MLVADEAALTFKSHLIYTAQIILAQYRKSTSVGFSLFACSHYSKAVLCIFHWSAEVQPEQFCQKA